MQIENILFDLDGTLIDSAEGIQFAIESAVASVLPDRQIPNLKLFIGPPVRKILEQILPDVRSEVLDKIIRQFREIYDEYGWKKSILYENARETIEYLNRQNIKTWIVTNKPNIPTIKTINHLEINHLFTKIFSLDSQVPHFQSKKEMVEFLMQEYKLNPSTTLLVGDSKDDAIAANSNGLHFTWASYGYGTLAQSNSSTITELSQLKSLL